MSDYIKREDALKIIQENIDWSYADEEISAFAVLKSAERELADLPSADVVERKDFDEVVKKMGERNCFTCGTYHDGEMLLLVDPQEVPTKVLEENDRAVSLAEVCKIIQDTYEVCPATWGKLRRLPTAERKRGEWLLDGRCSECLEHSLSSHKNYCPNCGADMRGCDNE